MKRILIVDDERDFCRLMKRNLEAAGDFEVSGCSNSEVATWQAQQEQPDLILLDVAMPGKSGPEVAEELRSLKETKTIPVVFLTALVTWEEIEENKNCIGGEHFIPKPVQTLELVRIINLVTKWRRK